MAKKRNTIDLTPWLMLGAGLLIGAAVTMLVAPKSGPDTRSLLRDKTLEIKDRASGAIGDTRDRAGKAIEDISHSTRERVNNLVHRGEQSLDEAQSQIQAHS